MTSDIVLAIVQIFGVFLVGWTARHLRYIEEPEISRWSRFTVDFLMPLLAFNSIVRGFEPARARALWPLPFLGLGMIVFGALAGIVLRRFTRSDDPNVVKTFHHFCAINNYGFLPIIIVQNLWGDRGLANLFVFNLGSNLGFWTIGVGLLGGADIRKTVRNVFSPNLVAIVLALIVCFGGLRPSASSGLFPAAFDTALSVARTGGQAAVPLMLILVGASLYPLPTLRDKRDVAYITVVRLVALPLLIVAGLEALPLDQAVRNIAVIVSLMPGPMSSVVITRRFGGSPAFAARAAVSTTLASMVTIPVALAVLKGIVEK